MDNTLLLNATTLTPSKSLADFTRIKVNNKHSYADGQRNWAKDQVAKRSLSPIEDSDKTFHDFKKMNAAQRAQTQEQHAHKTTPEPTADTPNLPQPK